MFESFGEADEVECRHREDVAEHSQRLMLATVISKVTLVQDRDGMKDSHRDV